MPNPNIQVVQQRLEASRKNLLDTGLRNKLINYRTPKATGVEVISEDPSEVFRMLVIEGKPMMFIGKPSAQEAQGELPIFDDQEAIGPNQNQQTEKPDQNEDAPPVDQQDTKLNTNETASSLHNRLLKTWRDAQSSLEEQGVNVLFLALGMLEWYESESSQEVRKAPLILVPVLIERIRGNQFRIRYEGTEIGENLSLGAKLHEFRVEFPELPEGESLDVRAYFVHIKQAVASHKRWRVNEQAISMGFFSYAKYLMYKDLEGTLWPEGSKPWANEIIGALLDCGFDGHCLGISEEENIDKHRPVKDAHEVCEADSSQSLAILEANSGRSMIIEGPPGTGKSQTITNLIAEAIGEGKRVLFVAEKRAALDVVWRNLKKAGLHKACLELHSNKTNKREFYSRLEETVKLGRPHLEEVETQLQRLEETRYSLNAYCEAVNQSLPHREIMPVVAMGRLLALGEEAEDLRKPDFSIMAGWRRTDFERRLELVRNIQSKVAEMGPLPRHPFFGSGLRLFLPDDRIKIVSQIKRAMESVQNALFTARGLAERMGLPTPEALNGARIICQGAEMAAASPPLDRVAIGLDAWQKNATRLRAVINTGRRFAQIRTKYWNTIKPESWDATIEKDRHNLVDYGKKWWRVLSGKYRASLNKLRSLCAEPLPKSFDDRLALADAILESQAKQHALIQAQLLCEEMFGIQWQGEQSDWESLSTILEWVLNLYKKVGAAELAEGIIKFLQGRYSIEGLADEASRVLGGCSDCAAKLFELLSVLQADDRLLSLTTRSFAEQLSKLNNWLENIEKLNDVVAFNLLHDEAKNQGMEAVAEIAASWEAAGSRLVEAFERTWYSGVLREAFELRPALARFDRNSHENAINSFRELDRLILAYNCAKVASKHWDGVPRHSAGGSLGALQREFARMRGHKPIRKIMFEAGLAIQAIKPVLMMSPLSVAMYLPPDGPKFDLVIFDEASQIKPEDAFSAIIRAKQAIVVGDSKQMPPTSFFDKLTQIEDGDDEGEEAEINVTRGMESILDLMGSTIPIHSSRRRQLKWHYRSEHDSLIVVSNRLSYKNELVVLPNADRQSNDRGLIYHHIPNTVYDRGGSRKNREEARVVAEAVAKHARKYPELSLGVAALSISQQEAIQEEIERLRRSEPALAELDRSNPIEPLFVKNLETVQGDERDVIFISIGYGRDENGRVSMNFGPLNQEGGERRLNVLITRARKRCEVFTNLRADDIRIDNQSKTGVKHLQTFLHFAETGELNSPTPTDREPMSPFEEQVIEAIRKHGYDVVPQVGSAGYFVDIGIRHPDQPGKFVLGIECDGAQYHRHKSARDRDRLRQEVLEKRGWRIHRIWSTDWWQNPDREMRRTLQAIEQAIVSSGPMASPDAPPAPCIEVERESTAPQATPEPANYYALSNLRISLAGIELRDTPSKRMAEWVRQVVEVESPVHFEEVVRRIREAAGLSRAGDPIRDAVRRGIEYAIRQGSIDADNEFLWNVPIRPPVIRNRTHFPNNLKKLELVHSDEIKSALGKVVEQSFGILREETIMAALRLLGFERTTETMRERTDLLVSDLVAGGTIRERGGKLQISSN